MHVRQQECLPGHIGTFRGMGLAGGMAVMVEGALHQQTEREICFQTPPPPQGIPSHLYKPKGWSPSLQGAHACPVLPELSVVCISNLLSSGSTEINTRQFQSCRRLAVFAHTASPAWISLSCPNLHLTLQVSAPRPPLPSSLP